MCLCVSQISCILMQHPSTYSEPVFPLPVIKVTLYASQHKQHFDSKMVSLGVYTHTHTHTLSP